MDSIEEIAASAIKKMSAAQLGEILLEILENDKALLENFIKNHTQTKDNPDSKKWQLLLKDKISDICFDLSWNLEKDRMYDLACEHSRRYPDEWDAFHAAIEEPLDSFNDYAKQLASDGYPAAALEFMLMGYKTIAETVKEAKLDSTFDDLLELARPGCRSILPAVFSACAKEKHIRLICRLAEKLPADKDCIQFLAEECRFDPEYLAVLKALDSRIADEIEQGVYKAYSQTELPALPSHRICVMKKMGLSSEDAEQYVLGTFGRLPFALKFLLDNAEERGDDEACLGLYNELTAQTGIDDKDLKKLLNEAIQFQRKLNLPDAEIKSLLSLVRMACASEEDIFRLRELLPQEEWIKLRTALTSKSDIRFGWLSPRIAGRLLEADEEYDALWIFLQNHRRKSVWLEFFDAMSWRHPEEYAAFLIEEVWESSSDDSEPYFRNKKRLKAEIYEEAAQNIEKIMTIPGQRDTALKAARALFEENRNSHPLKVVWMKHGFL